MARYSGKFPKLKDLDGDIVNRTAIELAWPYGTARKKFTYPEGAPVKAFSEAIDRVFPNRSKWGKQSRAGASCDVYAGVVARASGHDPKMPRGLDDQKKYFPKHPDKWKDIPIKSVKDVKNGDFLIYQYPKANNGSTGHICVIAEKKGVKYFAEAGFYTKRFGSLYSKAGNSERFASAFMKKCTYYKVYRPIGSCRKYLERGDLGLQVTRLQKFLNWFDRSSTKLVEDGIFGKKTEEAVRKFQTNSGISPDGIFGEKSLAAAMKANTKDIKISCIDISNYQGVISEATWKKIKKKHPAVILRCSWTALSKFEQHKDESFEKNIVNAYKAGMKIGTYHYSQAISEDEAVKEAEFAIKTMKKFKKYISLPVAFDWEFGKRLNATKAKSLGKVKCMNICNAFCDRMRKAGYETMVYANLNTLNNYISKDLYKHNKIWVAQYYSTCTYDKPYYMWQYSSSGKVDGIKGNVDMDYIYDSTV